jgi:hypothetical protein
LVQETLAEMRCDVMAMTAGSFYLAHLRDKIELGEADETDKQFFRFMINLNKYYASVTATQVVRRAIEILGGNGAMENFSVLPRLLRDCVIFEAWEGAHNTLLAQAVRDIQRHRLHEAVCARLQTFFPVDTKPESSVQGLRAAFETLTQNDELTASSLMRDLAEQTLRLFYAGCLAREDRADTVAQWYWQTKVEPVAAAPEVRLRFLKELSAPL